MIECLEYHQVLASMAMALRRMNTQIPKLHVEKLGQVPDNQSEAQRQQFAELKAGPSWRGGLLCQINLRNPTSTAGGCCILPGKDKELIHGISCYL